MTQEPGGTEDRCEADVTPCLSVCRRRGQKLGELVREDLNDVARDTGGDKQGLIMPGERRGDQNGDENGLGSRTFLHSTRLGAP